MFGINRTVRPDRKTQCVTYYCSPCWYSLSTACGNVIVVGRLTGTSPWKLFQTPKGRSRGALPPAALYIYAVARTTQTPLASGMAYQQNRPLQNHTRRGNHHTPARGMGARPYARGCRCTQSHASAPSLQGVTRKIGNPRVLLRFHVARATRLEASRPPCRLHIASAVVTHVKSNYLKTMEARLAGGSKGSVCWGEAQGAPNA